MSDYPSWQDDPAYADASWSAPPAVARPPPPNYGYGYGGSYDDQYSNRASAGYGGYENRGSAGYGGAGDRGGGGSHASSYVPKPGGAAMASEISYDTSSRDPALLRSRVFIGSLGNSGVVREDIIELCRPFGTVLAVTLFKGYAFVQFKEAEDADNSCEALDGKRWKGISIDCHLAMEGLVKKTLQQKRPSEAPGRGGRGGRGGGGAGGSVNDYPGSAKRSRVDTGPGMTIASEEAVLDANEQNRKSAIADTTVVPEMIGTDMVDTLICGTCRFVTCSFVAFREHRKKQCAKPKDAVEPPSLRCASCGLRFITAWKMLFHLSDFHRMQIFKAEFSAEAYERATAEDNKYKEVTAKRMDAWRKEHEGSANVFVVEPAAATVVSTGAEEQQQRNGGATKEAAAKTSFANDDNVNTFGGEKTEASATTASNGNGSGAVERVTTGADYDEDEEDEDDGAPMPISTLG